MKRLVVFLVLLASMLSIKAEEMYVVKSSDGSTLTFYYDDLKSSREGTVYEIDGDVWKNKLLDCCGEGWVKNITTAVFDDSFEDARPTSTSCWFFRLSNLESINYMDYFLNTSEVTDMSQMFCGCYDLNHLNVSNFDTGKVTDMEGMFSECMFLLDLDVSNFDTSNVTDMQGMFSNCEMLSNLNVSNFDTRKVTDMSGMFYESRTIKKLDLSSFDTSNVTDMGGMFYGCTSLDSLDISRFDVSKVEIFEDMCLYVGKEKDPCILTISEGFDFRKDIDLSRDYFIWWSGYFRLLVSGSHGPEMYVAKSTDGSTLRFYYDDLKSWRKGTVYGVDEWRNLQIQNSENSNTSWGDGITSVVFDASFKNARPTNTSYWFYFMTDLTTIENLEYLNTSEVTDMSYMFEECSSLSYLDLDTFDTGKVTDMRYMFAGCTGLESLGTGGFDTHNVTDMNSMFACCRSIMGSMGVSGFDTSNVTDMGYMFLECSYVIEIDVSGFDTHNVTNMAGMFCDCTYLESLDVSNFDTRNVKSMEMMFALSCSLKDLDVSNFDTRNVTNMNGMFAYTILKSLDLSNFDTSNVTRAQSMFENCCELEVLDISNFNLSKASSLSHMCTYVASAEHPCLLKVPENFDFREEIDFSGDYFMWQGGYFRLPSDELSVEPVSVLKGSPSTMAIELKNPSSKKYIGYQFKIVLPEGVSICKKDNGQYSYTQGNRYGNTQMMMNIREQNDGSYMVLCFSLSNTPISGHEGAILSLDITSDGSLDDGSYEGAIRGIKFSTTEDADALLPDATFKVNVSKYELGDVNNDGSVSISDITMAVNYILGKASDKFHASHGDMNHDGEINISDLSEMVEIILNSGNNAPVNIGVTGGLRMESAGSECSLYLPDAGLYKGCQFLVRVPSGCRLSDVSVGAGRESGHRVMYRQTGTGLYKVLVFSADGDEFEDVPSALLRLTVDGQNGGAVELSDIRFTDTDFTEHGFAAVSSEVTGIGAVAKGVSESTWYSLDGQKTAQPTKGVFVRDGRKVVVK